MPYKNPADKKAHNARHYRHRREHGEQQARLLPFAGVDGEGGDVGTGRQEYLLLRAGSHVLFHDNIPLRSLDCLRFIASLPHDRTYVSFSFNYDVTMMLRGLPQERWYRVLDRTKYANKFGACSVNYPFREDGIYQEGDVAFDYIPSKEFKVRIFDGNKWGKYVTIHDTFSFFQASFLSTVKTWLGNDPRYDDLIERVREGKERRDTFGAMTDVEIEYNHIECSLLARVMTLFAEKLTEAGIPALTKWQGPGHIASALFLKHGLPRRPAYGAIGVKGVELTVGRDYPSVVAMANDSYYGGRFEPLIMGEIDAPVYQYDIRSAYAAMYRHLPCLVHGTWSDEPQISRRNKPEKGYWSHIHENPISFHSVRFEHLTQFTAKGTRLGAFPVRLRDGSIQFPLKGEGVYTGYEISAACKTPTIVESIGPSIYYHRHCECVPMAFAEALYRKRLDIAAKDPNLGRVFKLALASMYGKLAQSIGNPVYSNPVWASLITGYVRAQLYSAAVEVMNGRGVVMLATDGIFTLNPIPSLDIGSNLGQWELTEHPHGMMVIQSGVYYIHDDTDPTVKSRGVKMSQLREQLPALHEIWVKRVGLGAEPRLRENVVFVRPHLFYGLRLARHLGKPEKAGTWEDVERAVGFYWDTKRATPSNLSWINGHELFITDPLPGVDYPSVCYSKDIGRMGEEAGMATRDMQTLRIEDEDQPDWELG